MSPKSKPKLPVQQLVVLSICRFAEPIALTSVFPYLPEMIESFGVPTNEIAKWAGITSSVFSLAQACTGILCGRAADRIGRKPVLLAGFVGVMVTTLGFGLSRTLTSAIILRSLSGAANGNIGVLRTTVAELVPQKELQPRAFAVMPSVWGVGSILGPILGGQLVDPAQQYPSIFDATHLFGIFPFLLPNLVASIIFLVGISTGFLFLNETLASRRDKRDIGRVIGRHIMKLFKSEKNNPQHEDEETTALLKNSRISSASTIQNSGQQPTSKVPTNEPPTTFGDIFTRQSSLGLAVYAIFSLHSLGFDQLLPIFMYHPRQSHLSPSFSPPFHFSGGFGIDHSRIGLLFTIYGVLCTFFQFVVYPPAANRFGVLTCLKFISILFPIAYFLVPFSVLFKDPAWQQASICAIMMIKGFASMFASPCALILIMNSAADYRILGTLNGVSTSLSAVGRAVGPAIGGAAFTSGVKLGYVILPWWILAGFAVLAALPVFWLEEDNGFRGGQVDASEDTASETAERASLLAMADEPTTGDGPAVIGLSDPQEAHKPSSLSSSSSSSSSLRAREEELQGKSRKINDLAA